ncbi:MAG: hypothetical protein LQ341_004317 [Variospora aurantia]|nr:MAG: hypothetical protein LQ341_004317 [Variospora aurantia]
MKLRNRSVAASQPAGPAKQVKGVQKKKTAMTTTTKKTATAATAAAPRKKKAAPKGKGKRKATANDTGSQGTTAGLGEEEEEEDGAEGDETPGAGDAAAEASGANADEPRRSARVHQAKAKMSKGKQPVRPTVASGVKGRGSGKKQAAPAVGGRRSSPRPLPSLPPGPNNIPAMEFTVLERDALRPHSTRVGKKWRGEKLPIFDEPFWNFREGRPTLMIPMVIDEIDHYEDIEEDEIQEQSLDSGDGRNPDDTQNPDENQDTERNEDTNEDTNENKGRANDQDMNHGQKPFDNQSTNENQDGNDNQGINEHQDTYGTQKPGNVQNTGDKQKGVENAPAVWREVEPFRGVNQRSGKTNGSSDDSRSPAAIEGPPPTLHSPERPSGQVTDSQSDSDYELESYDVPRRTKNRGTPRPGDEKLVGDGWPKYIRSHHGYEEGWVGRRPLGRGTQAAVGMWEKRDSSGRIVDVRMLPPPLSSGSVGKRSEKTQQICIKEIGEDHYLPYNPNKPFEAVIMEDLRDEPKNGIVRIRGYRRYPRRKVHLFLAAPRGYDEDGIPSYPTARLGDFGLALITGEKDPNNPAKFKGIGTPGYKAPEQKIPKARQGQQGEDYQEDFVEDEITDVEPLFSSKTNVWQVGTCIYKLMTLRDASYVFYGEIKRNGEVIPRIKTTRDSEYSDDLRELVHQCLNFWPDDRPGVEQLVSTVTRNRDAFRDLWAADPDPLNIPHMAILKYTREGWKEMEPGSWLKPRDPSETPPESFCSLKFSDSDFRPFADR